VDLEATLKDFQLQVYRKFNQIKNQILASTKYKRKIILKSSSKLV